MATASAPSRAGRLLNVGRRRFGAWQPTWSWAADALRSFVTSFLALAATFWLLPGDQADDRLETLALLAVLVLVLGAVLRPLLSRLTVLTGTVGLLLVGLLAQAVVLGAALLLIPSADPFSPGELLVASWAATLVAAVVNWLFDASSDEAFFGQLLRQSVRRTRDAGADGPGLLVVQLDGVSLPVVQQAIAAGTMPAVSRWLRSGSHELRGWHTGLPATTPAGQAVILHGDVHAVPGFRWLDKETGRLLVMHSPADAAQVEHKMSDGRGLLADGGTGVSNLFTGDAPTPLLTLSAGRLPGHDPGSASYAASRFGLVRSLGLFLGQVVTELYQARRQRVRDVVPRVHRGAGFVAMRGLTTAVLRDLDVTILADQMSRGTPVIYVDFVDYDEVAHHAGPTRPESLTTLSGLDGVLDFLDQVSREVGRRYEIALVSDHGQAQGSTFRQLAGESIEEVVQRLAEEHAAAPGRPGEGWLAANLLLAGAPADRRAVTRAARSLAGGEPDAEQSVTSDEPGLLVAASGSLAHVYRSDLPGRLTREQLDALHPGLVRGLADHPEVGLVLTRRADGAVVVDGGGGGWRVLGGPAGPADPANAEGAGPDPVAGYGPRAEADLLQLSTRDHVGDLVLLGAHDPALGEVVAFEELVGSHGGLGGPQTEALLVHPREWDVPGVPGDVLDGPGLHATLVGRLERLGLRR
ncbi:alkaline phosphatase family protein [Nocardioides marmotae]|uniref:alkaline phosphatase family protein n=1 Tax=Nocardioides marmotae TaxID=2663857 RepID=UPI0012B546EE|nr:alkaline phosphatase family protein [Nocardioides marmotae]MBC9732421.1 alkaline phosphatase family protein [Nocardioides marmotae]MTB83541.1 phosphodiesterase [Nocardioides marmotae]